MDRIVTKIQQFMNLFQYHFQQPADFSEVQDVWVYREEEIKKESDKDTTVEKHVNIANEPIQSLLSIHIKEYPSTKMEAPSIYGVFPNYRDDWFSSKREAPLKDPRDKYYQELMAGVVKEIYHLLSFVDRRKQEGSPFTSETVLQIGKTGPPVRSSTLIQQMKRDFDFLALRVEAGDYREDWEAEMEDALGFGILGKSLKMSIRDCYHNQRLKQHYQTFRDGTTWRDSYKAGLKLNAKHENMANEPLQSLLCRLESLSYSCV